jgi:hypothetical protein
VEGLPARVAGCPGAAVADRFRIREKQKRDSSKFRKQRRDKEKRK